MHSTACTHQKPQTPNKTRFHYHKPPATTPTLFLLIIRKPPPPRLIETQRVIPRLLLARNALRLTLIAILVVSTEQLAALVLLAHQRAQRGSRGAAHGFAQGTCEPFLQGRADGAQRRAEDVAWWLLAWEEVQRMKE